MQQFAPQSDGGKLRRYTERLYLSAAFMML